MRWPRFRFDLPCVFCGLPCRSGRTCRACFDIFPWNRSACERCALPLAAALPAGVACPHCQRSPPAFDRARAIFRYRFPIDAGLKRLKYSGRMAFAPAFAALLLPELARSFPDCDVLVPVPLHGWRHVRRGFNQAEALSRPLGRATGLPVDDSVRRVRATRSQSGLTAAERRRNVAGAFEAAGFSGRRPLIVDDVMTTGATADRLAARLREAGAARVGVLAVARAERP